jgi:cbb3-type cytochrome oxidase maturation protein
MDILFMLVPLSLILVALAIVVFLWMSENGQFEDLDGPAHQILMDDDAAAQARRGGKPVI